MKEEEEKGYAQQMNKEFEAKDLGWNKPQENIASPLVGGLRNEELWILIRRFNKVSPSFDSSFFLDDTIKSI